MSPPRLIKGRYEPVRLLGKGAMGEVYLCRDLELGRTLAVKAVRARWAGEEQVIRRFMREARIMASIEHPHLVKVYDIDEEGGIPFLVLEHIDGPDLSDVMERQGRLPLATVVRIASEVGGALDALHVAGVTHRDVKPANILVRRRDTSFVLMDLGLATEGRNTQITKSGQLIGTPRYMPPELLSGARSSPASDRFQLGVVLFEALTGSHLVPGRTLGELGRALRRGKWAPFPSDLPEVDEGFKRALLRAVAPAPEDRYPSCAAMVEALSAASGMLSRVVPASASPPRPPAPRRHLWLAPLVLGLSMAVGYLGPRWVGEPHNVRWRVVGDALLAEFEVAEGASVWMEVDGVGVQALATAVPGGRRLLYRGLTAGREVRARLAWRTGREAEAGFTGEPAAVGEELELAEERGVLLSVRRPVLARWKGGAAHRLERGHAWLAGPPPEQQVWELEWEEAGVTFTRRWLRREVLDAFIDAMEDRVRRIAGSSGQDRVAALQEAWARNSSWVPVVLQSSLPIARRRRFLALREASDRQVTGGALGRLEPDQPGARSFPADAEIPAPRVALVLGADRPPDPTHGGYAMFTNADESFNRREFNVPAPLSFQWPTIPGGADTVSLWLRVIAMEEGGQIRLRSLEGDAGTPLHLFAPRGAGGRGGRYDGWLRLVLPRDLVPAGGTRAVAELVTRDRNLTAGFFFAYLEQLVVSWTLRPGARTGGS